MKIKYLFSIIFCLIGYACFSQTYRTTFPTVGTSYNIKVEAKDGNTIEVSLKDGAPNGIALRTYQLDTSDPETYAIVFAQQLFSYSTLADTIKKKEGENWKAFGRKLYRDFVTSLQNTLPVSGKFTVNPRVKLYRRYIINGQTHMARTNEDFEVVRVQSEITEGYLENIIAYIKIDGQVYKYVLEYPMGMSSSENVKKFSVQYLYQMDSSPFASAGKDVFLLNLKELIDYDYDIRTGTRDYSSKDTTLNMLGGTTVTLHKDETNKLFEVHIYSDFKGFNEDKPNGLVQFELAKRININTVQHRSAKFLHSLFGSFGLAQYISPSITLSKIEQHNRSLNLMDLDSVRFNPGNTDMSKFGTQYHRYANALNLYQYQWLSAGADLNFLYLNNQARKFQFYVNVGARFGFTDTIDSLTKIDGTSITKTKFIKSLPVSTMQLYPELKLRFLPEERFNFSISNKWVYFKPLNGSIQMVGYDGENLGRLEPKKDAWLNISEMHMTIQVNPRSKVFGRFRMNWEVGDIKNNFSQLQVGYSTYILGK